MIIEKRYAPISYRTGQGKLEGTAVRYGDIARISSPDGYYNETVMPGAFGNLADADAILNVMHDRARPLARTGGGLVLDDSRERLSLSAALPNTQEGQDARAMLETRVYRGLSVEMGVLADDIDLAARLRRITRAELRGIALVDRPAYEGSEAVLKRFLDVEDRAKSVNALYKYGNTETIADTGRRRKRRIMPGAFRGSIDDPQQEITLSLGRNPNAAIGSKLAGTLILRDKESGLEIEVKSPPDTTAMRDFEAQVSAGMTAHVIPEFRELDGAYQDIPEPGNPGVDIRVYSAVKLYALALAVREPKGAESQVAIENRGVFAWL